jgi:hypothetical protein
MYRCGTHGTVDKARPQFSQQLRTGEGNLSVWSSRQDSVVCS